MLNHITLMGRMAADPELTTTPQGVSVCKFRIAVDRPVRAANKEEKKTDFFTIVAWRKTAEFVTKYFPKGRQIIVVGRLSSDDYTDKNGIKRYPVEVTANEIHFAGAKPSSAEEQGYSEDEE